VSGVAVGITATGTIASEQLWVEDGLQLPRLASSDRLLASRLIVSKRLRVADCSRSASEKDRRKNGRVVAGQIPPVVFLGLCSASVSSSYGISDFGATAASC
jgi:hypothetical protein